jgi:hypothetical protein
LVSIDPITATVIIAFAGAFFSLTKIFSDQTESIKNSYFEDVQRVQVGIKTTKIIPRLIDFVKGVNDSVEVATDSVEESADKEPFEGQTVSIEDYVGDSKALREIDQIGDAVKEYYNASEVYGDCVEATISCWKGSVLLGLVILAAFIVFPASDLLGAPILEELWGYVVAIVFVFAFAMPFRNYVSKKERLIKITQEGLLERRS